MTPDEFLNWKNARAQMQATRLPATMAAKPLPYDTQMEVARGQSWIVKTPASGIPPRTSYTPGRAICESFIVDENPTPPSLLEETNQDADTLEQYVYNLSTKEVAGGEWFIATQVGNVLVVAAGGGDGAKRVQFRSTTKMINGQITGEIILSEGEGSPQVGASQVFADPFNLFYSGEVDAIGWGYYRPANEHCELDEGRWEVEELSLPLDEAVGTVSECLQKNDTDAQVEIVINSQSAMWSQYHLVDLPPEMSGSTTTITALNTFKLDTCTGKKVRVRRTPEMIPSDPYNCIVPTGQTSQQAVWHIVQVEEQIARWLKVRYQNGAWEPFGSTSESGQAWDGCDPFVAGCLTPNIIDECGLPPCIPDNTCGIAHYRPETHEYIVTSTESALMGSPTLRAVPVAIADAGALYPCALEVTLQEVCLFQSDTDPIIDRVTPTYLTVDVVTDATTQGSQIYLNRSTITTCSITAAEPDVIDICPLLCACDQFYECCSAQCACDQSECVWDWDAVAEQWINTVPCPEGCDCSGTAPPTPAPGDPTTVTYACEDEPSGTCCDGVGPTTAVASFFAEFVDPNFFDFTRGDYNVAAGSSFSAAGPCGATLTFTVDWSNGSCQAQASTPAVAVLKKNGTCCYWEVTLTRPSAPCVGGFGDLGDGWPSSTILVPTCSGRAELDCGTEVGDCVNACDSGGFTPVGFTVSNAGNCT